MDEESQRRRSSSASSSPEFEFWMIRNPSFPPTELLSADELIVDGVVVPLHLLSLQRSYPSAFPSPDPPPYSTVRPTADPPPVSVLTSASFSAAPTSCSRRWKDMFRFVGEKHPEDKERERKDRRSTGSGSAFAELNINLNLHIWPFSRSHSAGTTAVRPRSFSSISSRKVSSAPCSRSNSRGESSNASGFSRRWNSSPARGGIHLGRSSPVWRFRRTGIGPKDKPRNTYSAPGGTAEKSSAETAVRLLNLNSCIGYQNQVSYRDDDSNGLAGRPRTAEGTAGNGSIFNIRALFSKKVY